MFFAQMLSLLLTLLISKSWFNFNSTGYFQPNFIRKIRQKIALVELKWLFEINSAEGKPG